MDEDWQCEGDDKELSERWAVEMRKGVGDDGRNEKGGNG